MSVSVGHTVFIKNSPPKVQVPTKAVAALHIPATVVDTSRCIPVVDKTRMMMQEAPVPAAVDNSRDIPVVDKTRMMMQEAPVMEPDEVVLTTENFRSFLSNNKFAFVVFHGPDCDDLWDKLITEWEAFAQQSKTDQVAVAVGKVDCAQEKSICEKSMTRPFRHSAGIRTQNAMFSVRLLSQLSANLGKVSGIRQDQD
jgi:hypothetical protein